MQWQLGHEEFLEHVQSSPVTRRYTWRHNRVLQGLAVVISMAKGQSIHPEGDPANFILPAGRLQPAILLPQREALSHGTEEWSNRQTRENVYLTSVTTRKIQQIFQNGTTIPGYSDIN